MFEWSMIVCACSVCMIHLNGIISVWEWMFSSDDIPLWVVGVHRFNLPPFCLVLVGENEILWNETPTKNDSICFSQFSICLVPKPSDLQPILYSYDTEIKINSKCGVLEMTAFIHFYFFILGCFCYIVSCGAVVWLLRKNSEQRDP